VKLHPTQPTGGRIAVNIRRFVPQALAPALKEGRLNEVALLANGTPDDVALALAAHHLNGKHTIGVAKPPRSRGPEVVKAIPQYVKLGVKTVLLLIDQEEREVEEVLQLIGEKASQAGIKTEKPERKTADGRLTLYRCRHGTRRFNLVIIINGLEEISTKKHTVEDHLLKAAQPLLKTPTKIEDDPKTAWKRLKQQHGQIYQKLREKLSLIRQIFPQHIKGLRLLTAEP